MAWTTPKTWATDELVTASNLNTHLRDNLNALKSPPSAAYTLNEAADFTTTSTSFVDVSASKLALTITTAGGDVLVHFDGRLGATARVYLDVAVDGTRLAGDDGITANGDSGTAESISFTRLITGLSAGAHTFKLQWKVNTGTGTLYAGAGTSALDLHPQFWVREVS